MDRYLILIFSVTLTCILSSCQENRQTGSTNRKVQNDSIFVKSGEKWLKENIESFFNNEEYFRKGFSFLCTREYAEFKQDALNVDLDGGMTGPDFKSKWGRRVNEFAGIGEGFMIAGTDFGQIEVAKCEFRNMTEMKNYLYDVLILDKTFNSKFIRQIILVKNGDSYLIDNVLEISNEFENKN